MDTVRVNLTIFISACLLFVSGVVGVIGWGWAVVAVTAFLVPVTYWRWIYALSENKYAEPDAACSVSDDIPWPVGSAAFSCYRGLYRCDTDAMRVCLTYMFVELFCDENGELDPDMETSAADFVESASIRISDLLKDDCTWNRS